MKIFRENYKRYIKKSYIKIKYLVNIQNGKKEKEGSNGVLHSKLFQISLNFNSYQFC